jgi:hypothetical protein
MIDSILRSYIFKWLKVGSVKSGDYTHIEEDGTIVSYGDATVWNDKSFPMTSTRLGALSKPDFDLTNVGLLFPQNDASEKVYVNDQMSHEKKLDMAIKMHVHFVQDSSDIPIFKIDYRLYKNGQSIPNFTTIDTSGESLVYTYVSGSIIQIIPFPDISAPLNETISANLDMIFYRDDNVVSGDVLVKFVDYHYEKDMNGSREEYSK